MKKFTVTLLYPDYLDDFPQTWDGFVEASNLLAAVQLAQIQCAENYRKLEGEGSFHPGDLYPISVFEGHHFNQVGEWAAQYNSGLDARVVLQNAA